MKTKKITNFIFAACAFFGATAISAKTGNKGFKVDYSQTRGKDMNLNFTIDKPNFTDVTIDGITYTKLEFSGGVLTNQNGYAALPIIHASVQLPADKNVTMQVINGSYTDYSLTHPLLPSRGTIYRNQDPSKIPYKISPASIVDQWYPIDNASMVDPFIVRDIRGTSVYVYPMQYNAAKNILRVYNTVAVNLVENNSIPVNPLTEFRTKVESDANSMYQSLFINYNKTRVSFPNEIGERGDILVIHTSRDAAAIAPYIAWKKQMGYSVTSKQVAVGTNAKADIASAYAANKKLFYVLLVGDWADIKSDLGSSGNAPMDPMMGCVVGTDKYPDICIGRFSAASAADVTTQVNKTIKYEKTPGGTWYKASVTIGSSEGPGDDNEIDNAHVMNIYNGKLKPYTYTSNTNCTASSNASSVSTPVNAGCGLINYIGHGSETQWVTSGFSNSNISSLTNSEKLPFIISVACVNGAFHSTTSFSEAWLRKSGGGAVAIVASTINQPWNQPMIGQDYMNDLVVGGHTYTSPEAGTNTDHGVTHFGSIVNNGTALMYAEDNGSDALDTKQTWTTFGDPSLQVRTDAPKTLVVSNLNYAVNSYVTNISVGGKPFENALVSLWDGVNQPLSGYTDASGNVTIASNNCTTCTLTVTGYNLIPFIANSSTATGIDSKDNVNAFSIYPIPSNGQFTIDYTLVNDQTSNVKVYDLLGHVIYTGVLEQNKTNKIIDLSNFQNGVYFMAFEGKTGTVTKKIVIQK